MSFVKKDDNIIVHYDKDLPLLHGECPSCKSGNNTLILVDFVPRYTAEESMLYMKCVACFSLFQTKISNVTEK